MHDHSTHIDTESVAKASPDEIRSEKRRLSYAILVTASILVAEIIGGLLSGSLALLSDAGHMFVDSLALVLSLVALNVSQKSGSEQYTFGLARVEILAALLNGVTLLVVCSVIVYEAVQRFITPVEIDITMMLIVAGIGIAANIVSAILLRNASSLNVRSAFLHVLGDLLSSIGIVVAGVLMLFWDVPWLDPALSIAISIIILFSAYRLVREALNVLMEKAPGNVDVSKIRKAVEELEFVENVHDFHVWSISSGMVALACHVVLVKNPGVSPDEALRTLDSLMDREFDISHTTIQIESSDFEECIEPCT